MFQALKFPGCFLLLLSSLLAFLAPPLGAASIKGFSRLTDDGVILGFSDDLLAFYIGRSPSAPPDQALRVLDLATSKVIETGIVTERGDVKVGADLVAVRSSESFYVFDRRDQSVTDLELKALGEFFVAQDRILFLVLETHTDINGDGDVGDVIVHIYNGETKRVSNTHLAVFDGSSRNISIQQGRVAILVGEREQGRIDLNEDGDVDDAVLQVLDLTSGDVFDLGLATVPGPPLDRPHRFLYPLLHEGRLLAFRVDEAGNGGADLNGDGDGLDQVVHVFDVDTNTVVNLNLASMNPIHPFLVAGSLLALSVSEQQQGSTDLNGDGDALDDVLFVAQTLDGSSQNIGIAAEVVDADGELGLFLLPEFQEGRKDANQDGDHLDRVYHLFDARDGSVSNLGLAATISSLGSFLVQDEIVAFAVKERQQGDTDLNADGDLLDGVAFVYDHRNGSLTNLAMECCRLGRPVDYFTENRKDHSIFRRQGDLLFFRGASCQLMTAYDLRTRIPVLIGRDFLEDFVVFPDDVMVITAREMDYDLNRDGDKVDLVTGLTTLDEPFGSGNVELGEGGEIDLLRINGRTGSVNSRFGVSIAVSLDAPPLGGGPYVIWIWSGAPKNPTDLRGQGGGLLGCLVNPTPLSPNRIPQPISCIRSTSVPDIVCGGLGERLGPDATPMVFTHSRGLRRPVSLTLQAVVRDPGAMNSRGISVTNATRLTVVD